MLYCWKFLPVHILYNVKWVSLFVGDYEMPYWLVRLVINLHTMNRYIFPVLTKNNAVPLYDDCKLLYPPLCSNIIVCNFWIKLSFSYLKFLHFCWMKNINYVIIIMVKPSLVLPRSLIVLLSFNYHLKGILFDQILLILLQVKDDPFKDCKTPTVFITGSESDICSVEFIEVLIP